MTDDMSPGTRPEREALDPWSAHVAGLLDNPAVWAEPSPGVEDQVVAAILAGAAARPAPPARPPVAPTSPEPPVNPFSPDLTVVAPLPPQPAVAPPVAPPAQPAGGPPSSQSPSFDPAVTGALPPEVTGSFGSATPGSVGPAGPATTGAHGSATPGVTGAVGPGPAPVVSLDAARRRRRPGGWLLGGVAIAAAVAVVAIGALAVVNRDDSIVAGTEVALAGSQLVPDASAVAHVEPRDDGVRIVLEVTGLPPAPPGSFYAAWVVKEEPRTRIPIGSFHLRGGGADQIELWSGVSADDYPIVSVTRQSEADPAGPGEPMLRGRLGG
ncbi:MAG: hypothetical protein OEY41_14115 [Acidimicrobiia bacterium]|nr:hypothetical protein [Acidimicrobiia bacterium]MDH4363933.1 hypothetical protein [Acidimicrobiia bacterium]MDH5291125.1 hypothetical protein [Acidimicrobiia bacterium]